MNKLCLLSLALATGAAAAEPAVTPALNARLRYETVDQTGLRDASALTLRTRLGLAAKFETGFSALLEAENITAADGDAYNQAGLNPGGAGRAVVADPETTELNQAWFAWRDHDTAVTVGRQRLVLDNARFVGDVGWRQNAQTFDAVVLQNRSVERATFTYAYLDRINRVFGHEHAQGRWHGDSHLFNANYQGLPVGTLTGYAYLLDFDAPAAANSCATYGASIAGSAPLANGPKLTWRAEYATQRDYGASPLHYSADYYALEFGVGGKPGALALGHEVLGAGTGGGFRTPLATLHAFNGWADMFLTTPVNGLRDTYLKTSAPLPAKISLLGFYHHFSADRGGSTYGEELDLQLSRQLNQHLTALIKAAQFHGEAPLPDVRKIWLQLEYTL